MVYLNISAKWLKDESGYATDSYTIVLVYFEFFKSLLIQSNPNPIRGFYFSLSYFELQIVVNRY